MERMNPNEYVPTAASETPPETMPIESWGPPKPAGPRPAPRRATKPAARRAKPKPKTKARTVRAKAKPKAKKRPAKKATTARKRRSR